MKAVFLGGLIFLSQAIFGQNLRDSLSNDLERIIADSDIPGLGVSIIGENGILYSKGFGYRDIKSKSTFDSLTVQSVASISKTMIAVSLMKLAEKGKISLEADINMYLPFKVINPNFPKNKITLLQLATHTSSIVESDHADDNSYFVIDKKASKEIFPKGSYKYYKRHLKNENTTIEEYLKSHLVITGDKFNNDIFGDYVPGTQYSYSNVASTLAAYLIEILSGQTFESFTEENIFSPLQMENTSWKHPKGENVASKYFHNGFKVPDYTLITFPSGGLQTSSYDMAKFMSEMMNGYLGKGKLLSKESYHYMFTNRLDSEKISKTQGLFWDINLEGNISHGGAEIGTTCQVIFSPKLKKAFFMMINMTVYDQEILERSYRDLLITISRYAKSLN